MAKQPKLDSSLLHEFWDIERHDCCLGGLTYLRKRVYVCCAKTKQEVKDGIAEYKQRMCKGESNVK